MMFRMFDRIPRCLPHKLVKHPERNISDKTGQLRFSSRNVDRRADKNSPSHLFGKRAA
jgi:hypothetical protein